MVLNARSSSFITLFHFTPPHAYRKQNYIYFCLFSLELLLSIRVNVCRSYSCEFEENNLCFTFLINYSMSKYNESEINYA